MKERILRYIIDIYPDRQELSLQRTLPECGVKQTLACSPDDIAALEQVIAIGEEVYPLIISEEQLRTKQKGSSHA